MMRAVQRQKSKSVPLSKIVHIPPKAYPSTNIENDSIENLQNYIPSASTIDIADRFTDGLRGYTNGRMISVTGPFGSGKSTMAMFMKGLIAGKTSEEWRMAKRILKNESPDIAKALKTRRKSAGIHQKGLVRCVVMARREPVGTTLLRALDTGAEEYFGKYGAKDFAGASELRRAIKNLKNGKIPRAEEVVSMVTGLCKVAPVMIMIDEFGKNIEYFAADGGPVGDLYILQEMAEMSGNNRKIPLFIMTLQHMAFEEYAAGATASQKREWAKIQGRFEDVPFTNSPDQTRQLVSNTIDWAKSTRHGRDVDVWAKAESRRVLKAGLGSVSNPELISHCYPLSPLAIEILPELCSRYGQHERTLLSFLADSGRNTVSTFIDEATWEMPGPPPVMGLDRLYDYFISGTNVSHASSSNITRLMEIVTVIRDAYGFNEMEVKTLKTIGVLNLVSRSGRLGASKKILDYAMGQDTSAALKRLESKSIITYRDFAGEYRIWHGTDVNISSELEINRKKYRKSSLLGILREAITLTPVIAGEHSIETGTIRTFERHFGDGVELDLDSNAAGAIVYVTDNLVEPDCDRPVIMVQPGSTSDLKHAAIEVLAIREILNANEGAKTDWVARKELRERLAHAEIRLSQEFSLSYGESAVWKYKGLKFNKYDTPNLIASKVSDVAYSETPRIHNDMINRAVLSSQGASAKRILLERMILHRRKAMFGIEGYGPERAVYDAIFRENDIHAPIQNKTLNAVQEYELRDPTNGTLVPVWKAIIKTLKKTNKRVNMSEIYDICGKPPYGMKTEPILVLVVAIMLIHEKNIALYEHGTYVPYILPEITERMTKNPINYELKYVKATRDRTQLLAAVTSKLGIKSDPSILGVVSHLTRIASGLHTHMKTTKKMKVETIAVRDAILEAREPDTLLFESLPAALGYGPKIAKCDIPKFAKKLAESINRLQNGYEDMLRDINIRLMDLTGMEDRYKLSKAASAVAGHVSDKNLKVFLEAISADSIERDEDWITYVAMTLTGAPPASWTDGQRDMQENALADAAARFKRLAAMHFPAISGSLAKSAFHMTVTLPDGSESYKVVSLKPEQKRRTEQLASKIMADMKKRGLSRGDLDALIAVLATKAPGSK
ncbi:MAG: hypothetical protein MPK75_02965 [Alphaproteobacteria bacterium]|nr:hypothetical protein [Alphaproteobacteria bacterium]